MKKIFAVIAPVAIIAATFAGPVRAADALAKKGDVIDGVISQTLSSKTSANGTTFTLSEKETWLHHNAALAGATIDGHIENVSPAGPLHKASMTIVFDDLKTSDGTSYPIDATLQSLSLVEPHTHHLRDAGLIIGGAIAGKMVGHKHGTVAGAAAGFALVSTMKSDIVIKQGTLVKLKLKSALVPGA